MIIIRWMQNVLQIVSSLRIGLKLNFQIKLLIIHLLNAYYFAERKNLVILLLNFKQTQINLLINYLIADCKFKHYI